MCDNLVDLKKSEPGLRTPRPGLKLTDWRALSAFEMGAGALSSPETDRAALRAALGDLYLRHATELTNPLGLDFSSFGTMKTSPNSRFYFFSSAHRTSLDALAFAVRILDACCFIRCVAVVQKASAFGVCVEAWSTLCVQVDPGSGA